jgi:cysteine desulfuration protein SufE
MSPTEKQQQLVSKISLIEDLQERMAYVVERVRKLPPIAEEEKTDSNRVQGCVSRVWLVARVEDEILRLSVDADSTLVRGLAWLVCETYDGTPVTEAASFTPSVLEDLRLSAQLSPTRRNGLEQVQLRIRQIATNATTA